ncbi:hypothetical protein FB472_1119 [Rhodoglobus vestalii]|uniref:Methionine/alanine importer small subunit n=1 Tax=Rhodoglobus vestalii TaxID=193384 RepID=A0A8H2PXR5_9MICO|nr:MetS family NSS transporter small subunit [Rhodoglobus vestalii]TQO19554.1 hypothetical protein FB472_1119 [Rhodoglobus vestalii]
MTGIAFAFFLVAAVLVWGGLIASIIFIARRPQVEKYPEGSELVGDDD